MKPLRPLLLAALWLTACVPPDTFAENAMPKLDLAKEWLNSPPLRAADLKGKVVLVDFWTYTCINWRRTLPYLRAWSNKYGDQGLVVVGVHTPEFSFEKNLDHVRRAVKDQDIAYPVAIDSDYAIWNAFDNNYWPALYLVDAKGQIRHHQFGEGEYDKLENVIRQLLTESGQRLSDSRVGVVDGEGAEAFADWKNLQSPETYIGTAQATRFVSTGRLKLNEWSLNGNWAMKREFAVSREAKGSIAYRFHARDVHLVMGPAKRGATVRFRVSIDGKPPGAARGVDVDAEGVGQIEEPRMYQLIRQPGPIADRQFEIEFLDAGAEVYVFTFG